MPHIDKRIPRAVFRKIARDKNFIPFDEWFKKFHLARKKRSEKIWIEQDKKCVYCKRELVCDIGHPLQYTLDHIIPISNGGTESPRNYQITCGVCNGMKGSMCHEQFSKIVYDYDSLRAERDRKLKIKIEKKEKKENALMRGELNQNQTLICYGLALLSYYGLFDLKSTKDSIELYMRIVKTESKKKSRAYKRTVLVPKISTDIGLVACCV